MFAYVCSKFYTFSLTEANDLADAFQKRRQHLTQQKRAVATSVAEHVRWVNALNVQAPWGGSFALVAGGAVG